MPLSVATTCPACGGSLEFPHGSTAVRCGYCGSSHLVTGHGRTLSYVIPERVALAGAVERALVKLREKGGEWQVREATLFFVPYHHFTGQDLFWCLKEEAVSGGDDGEERSLRADPTGRLGLDDFLNGRGETPGFGAPRLTEKRFELATRHIDRTLPALDAAGLKVCTLGLRPEVLRLSLFQKVAVLQRGQVSPVRAHGEELERQGYAPVQTEGIVARRVIGRTRSIIHFPFWIIEAARDGEEGVIVVVDGVSGDVTNDKAPPGLLDSLVARDGNHFETVGMRPLKCPDCGADLPARPRDVVFFCAGCGKAWQIRDTDLLQVPYTVIPRTGGTAGSEYFPFWVLEARVVSGGEAIDNKYGLTRLAPGLRVPREEDRQVPLRFFVPAFRIGNLNILSRLAGNFTRTQPVWQGGDLPRGTAPARGCFISPDDVLELAPLILFSLVPKGNKRALKFALEAQVEVKGAELVLVPFARSVMDYTDEVIGQSMPVAALRD